MADLSESDVITEMGKNNNNTVLKFRAEHRKGLEEGGFKRKYNQIRSKSSSTHEVRERRETNPLIKI